MAKKAKVHGNTGKRNAAKPKQREGRVSVPVYEEEKAEWAIAAESEGLPLAVWVREVINEAL